VDLFMDDTQAALEKKLFSVRGLKELVDQYYKKQSAEEKVLLMEFVLYGLAAYSQLNRDTLDQHVLFKDLFSSVFNSEDEDFGLN
jgi:magnesium chelatase subunit I